MVNNDFLMGYGAGKAAGGGGGPTLITKTITENGTYAASSDNADGYSEVTVDVAGGGGSVIPAGYTQLEFIAGDGVAWIDTDEYRQAGDELILYGGLLRTGAGNFWHPFGTGNCFVQVGRYSLPSASATVRLNSGGNISDRTFTTMLCHTVITDTKISQHSYLGHDETVVAEVAGTVSTDSRSMALFARRTASGADYPANGFAIFNFKWYRSGTLIHNMVPAVRDADEVIGMYDVATGNFYTNAAASGNFWGETID